MSAYNLALLLLSVLASFAIGLGIFLAGVLLHRCCLLCPRCPCCLESTDLPCTSTERPSVTCPPGTYLTCRRSCECPDLRDITGGSTPAPSFTTFMTPAETSSSSGSSYTGPPPSPTLPTIVSTHPGSLTTSTGAAANYCPRRKLTICFS